MGLIRILFMADTHLGFDLPFRHRIQRRRRGPEFFANFKHALQSAVKGRVDCVLRGGDLLYRNKVAPSLVAMAFEPLKQVADYIPGTWMLQCSGRGLKVLLVSCLGTASSN